MGVTSVAGRVVAGRYVLVEQIRQTEAGVTWRATDRDGDRDVAVMEVVLPESLDEADSGVVRARISRDAEAATKFDHPGAVRVLGVAEERNDLFVVTELVDAPTLDDVVRRDGPLPAKRVTAIGSELLDVLAAAHAAGIVHRRVSPENVLVPNDTAVRLAGFGVGSVNAPPPTGSAPLRSSPYGPPEHAAAPGAGATAAADVWSAGATLRYAADGRPPARDNGERPEATNGSLGFALDSLMADLPSARPDAAAGRAMLQSVAEGDTGGGGDLGDQSGPPKPPHAGNPPETAPSPHATVPEPWFFPETVKAVEVPADPADFPEEASTAHHILSRIPLLGRRWQIIVLSCAVIAVLLVLMVTGGKAVFRNAGNQSVPPPKGVPSNWVSYRDPDTTFLIWHPPTWSVDNNDATTELSDPVSGARLRVERREPPTPAGTGLPDREATFAANHPGYVRNQIGIVQYGRAPAALWEYTYPSGDTTVHAADLSFPTPRYTFDLTFQTNGADWDRLVPLFNSFKAAFRAVQRT